MRLLGWAVVHYDWCLYKKRRLVYRQAQKEDHKKAQEGDRWQAKERGLRRNQSC